MQTSYLKKKYKEPEIKIGSKKEKTMYSDKNIDPNLNFFNRQLIEEENLSRMRKQSQKEELSTISKYYEDNYSNRPNLAHQKIDFDNVAGKIGQEKRQEQINKYQQQRSYSKDQVFYKNIENSEKKKNIHSIINNTIFGFCDPSLKFPKTSYQANYEPTNKNSQLEFLSKMQYEDYLIFRKQQNAMMNKGNLGKNLRELPPRSYINKKELIEQKNLRDKKYKDDLNNLMREQRLLDQNQASCLTQPNYIPTLEEYEYLKQKQMMEEKNKTINNTNQRQENANEETYQHLIINHEPNSERSNQINKYKNECNNSHELNYNNNYYNKRLNGEEQIDESQRKEAEEEYLKNLKKYEDILKDNPEQKYKIPGSNFHNNIENMASLNNGEKEFGNPKSAINFESNQNNIYTNNSCRFDYGNIYNRLDK